MAQLEKRLIQRLKTELLKNFPDAFVFKHIGYTAGIPDLICSINGRFVGIEVKSSKSVRLSRSQKAVLTMICRSGGIGIVMFGDRVLDVVEYIKKEVKNGRRGYSKKNGSCGFVTFG